MYRLASATTTRFLSGLLDTDDSTPEAAGDPRVTLGTSSGSTLVGNYTGNGASTNDTTSATYSGSAWTHVACKFTGSGSTLTSVEVFVNGTGTGSPGSASRDLSVGGVLDRLQIGSNTANHSNCDFAHWAYFDAALSQDQITELQTKLPSAITGATPTVYYDLISATTNSGSGGSTYDLTLSGAALNSTNDGSLPSLSGSGGASDDIAVTDAGDAANVTGQTPAIGTIAVTDAGDTASVTGQAPVLASVAVTDAGDTSSVTGSAGTAGVRLQLGLERERGALAASLTGLVYVVFNSTIDTVVTSGSALTTDGNGVTYVDLADSEYEVGDYVPMLVTQYDSGVSAPDRVVRSMFGFVPAIAIP